MNAWVHKSDLRKRVQAAMCSDIQQEINSPAFPYQVSSDQAAVAINFYRGGKGGKKGWKFWTFKLVPLIAICKFRWRDQRSNWLLANFNSSFTWWTKDTGHNSKQLECKLSNYSNRICHCAASETNNSQRRSLLKVRDIQLSILDSVLGWAWWLLGVMTWIAKRYRAFISTMEIKEACSNLNFRLYG